MESVTYTLTSVCPLVMHNGQLSDPLNAWAKALKKLTGKRAKTDADHEEVGRTEWFGALYLDAHMQPCLPGEVLETMLFQAAAKSKRKQQAKGGLICDGNFPLQYTGPTTPEALWEDGGFTYRLTKKQGTSRVVRTLPIFRQWSATIDLMYAPSVLNKRDVDEILHTAGSVQGLMEFRPRFGRFSVT